MIIIECQVQQLLEDGTLMCCDIKLQQSLFGAFSSFGVTAPGWQDGGRGGAAVTIAGCVTGTHVGHAAGLRLPSPPNPTL